MVVRDCRSRSRNTSTDIRRGGGARCDWSLALSLTLVICLTTSRAFAEDKIDTDGPDFVESSEVVGSGRFQFETGPAVTKDHHEEPHRQTVSTPTLFRFGVSDTVEARFETEGRLWLTTDATSTASRQNTRATADSAVGLKWHSQDRDPALGRAAVSWLLHVEMSSGSTDMRGNGLRPSLRSVMTWDLPDEVSVGLMPGIKYDTTSDDHRFLSGIIGATAGKWWTGNFRSFVEVSGEQIARNRDGGVVLSWDVGASYLLSNNWQLGGRMAVAANRNTPSQLLLLSLAARF